MLYSSIVYIFIHLCYLKFSTLFLITVRNSKPAASVSLQTKINSKQKLLLLIRSSLPAMQSLLLRCMRFGFLLFYVITISFRLAFIPYFNIFEGATAALFFDYLADLFFILDYASQSVNSNSVIPATETYFHGSNSVRGPRVRIFRKSNRVQSSEPTASVASMRFEPYYQLLCVFPIEAFAYLAGYPSYYVFRILRLFRCYYFNLYWRDIAEMLEKFKIATNPGTQRVALLTLIMALVAHVMACFFYAIGLNSIRAGHINNWVYVDDLAIPGGSTGEVNYLQSLSFRYLRSIYFSIQTITSITYGDIAAHSQGETWFCILYFLVAAGIIYMSIANLTMIVSKLDSAQTEHRMKIIKFEKYAAYRQLPPALTHRVVSYYKHQWERLRGVDEQKVQSFIE